MCSRNQALPSSSESNGSPFGSSASVTIPRDGCPSSTSRSSSARQTAVLHTGDADPQVDNFSVLNGLPAIDLALLPFWYVLDETSRTFVERTISPRRIVGMHLPPEDAADVQRKMRDAKVAVTLLIRGGENVRLSTTPSRTGTRGGPMRQAQQGDSQ